LTYKATGIYVTTYVGILIYTNGIHFLTVNALMLNIKQTYLVITNIKPLNIEKALQ